MWGLRKQNDFEFVTFLPECDASTLGDVSDLRVTGKQGI